MVASDGSVVALRKRQTSAALASPSASKPLDVLLLTDALPANPPKGPESAARPASPASSPVTPAAVLEAAGLEDTVRQSLEPKIQEWLNANLLEIVERLVQQEIDKISRRT